MNENYDLVVIGAGPGGYIAALRAAQLGMKVVVVDLRDRPGGTCLNVGCIPSKALLDASEKIAWLEKRSAEIGLENVAFSFNFEKLMKEKEAIVDSLTGGIRHLFESKGIQFVTGQASFKDASTVEVDGKLLKGRYILIASGSSPIELPFLPFDEKIVLSSTGALDLKNVPKTLLVVGGGVIGVELASVYRRLGAEVSVIEMLPMITPTLDRDLSKALLTSLKKEGIQFHLGKRLIAAEIFEDSVLLKTEQESFKGEKVLVAVGRRPYTEALGLKNLGIATDSRGCIQVDSAFRTKEPHIFAIGDVIDGPMLAHKASEEGVVVAELMGGKKASLDYLTIPSVVYTHPEAASVGMTEEEAKKTGFNCLIGIAYLKGNPRARASLEKEGLVKVIGDKATGLLLGLHVLAPHASEMMALGSLAIGKRMHLEDVAKLPFAHPSLSEAMKEAFLAALGKALHG